MALPISAPSPTAPTVERPHAVPGQDGALYPAHPVLPSAERERERERRKRLAQWQEEHPEENSVPPDPNATGQQVDVLA
jgi:hypothetical protein